MMMMTSTNNILSTDGFSFPSTLRQCGISKVSSGSSIRRAFLHDWSAGFVGSVALRQRKSDRYWGDDDDDDDDFDSYYSSKREEIVDEDLNKRKKENSVRYKENFVNDDLPFPEPRRSIGTRSQSLARYSDDDYEYDDNYNDDDDEIVKKDAKFLSLEDNHEVFDDDTDSYYDDDDDDNDFEDEDSVRGNFWSNPSGGMDKIRRPMTSTKTPRMNQQRPRRTSRSREDFSKDPNAAKKRKRSQIRSDMSQAPVAARDLYERLFWYDFDPEESADVGDKTVFGGTKGKFNGLAFLQASEDPRRSVQSRRERQLESSSSKTRRSRQEDYYEYGDEYEYDEDFDEYGNSLYDDEILDEDTISKTRSSLTSRDETPPQDLPKPQRERLDTSRRRSVKRARPSPRRRRPRDFENDYEEEEDNDDDGFYSERYSNSNDASRGGDWVSKQVSSWFNALDDIDDDYEDYDEVRSTGRQRRRQQRSQNTGDWSPFNVLDAFLGIDREELSYKAEMYNTKMGIGSKARPRESQRSGRQPPSQRRTRGQRKNGRGNESDRRRSGYAYRYRAEDDLDDEEYSSIVDIEPIVDEEKVGNINVIESLDKNEEKDVQNTSDNVDGGRELTWEERAMAVEQVPPANVPAWGPSGKLPTDARTKAIIDALEDIQIARRKVESREKREALAREEITILKVDAEIQRRQLESSQRQQVSLARGRLRQIELEIDDASRVLRRARTKVQLAKDQLDQLKARHWAVLGFYNPDLAEEKVDEALNDFPLPESTRETVEDVRAFDNLSSNRTSVSIEK